MASNGYNAYGDASTAGFTREGLIASSTILWAIAISVIVIRTTHRKYSGSKLYADDVAMVMSGVLITVFQGICVSQAKTGVQTVPGLEEQETSSGFLFTIWIGTPVFIMTVGTLRASLLLYWLRLCASVGPRLKSWAFALRIMAWINAGLTLSGFVSNIFTCWPLATYWHPLEYAAHPEHCVNLQFKFLLGNSINTGINLIIFLAPIPILRACPLLYVTWKKRFALACLYGVGLILVIVSIMPVITLKILHVVWLDPQEPTANMFGALIWLVVEVHLGPVVACVPTLIPFYKDVGRKLVELRTGMRERKQNRSAKLESQDMGDTEGLDQVTELTHVKALRISVSSRDRADSICHSTVASTCGNRQSNASIQMDLSPGKESTEVIEQYPTAAHSSNARVSRLGDAARTIDPETLARLKSVMYEA